mmetsp:Transcript_11010/g.17633  ORF Transcript_11010/g.17633 Transcript_11010/m.17633 type:complete len:217 (-) Transcript_11010:64-714(-)
MSKKTVVTSVRATGRMFLQLSGALRGAAERNMLIESQNDLSSLLLRNSEQQQKNLMARLKAVQAEMMEARSELQIIVSEHDELRQELKASEKEKHDMRKSIFTLQSDNNELREQVYRRELMKSPKRRKTPPKSSLLHCRETIKEEYKHEAIEELTTPHEGGLSKRTVKEGLCPTVTCQQTFIPASNRRRGRKRNRKLLSQKKTNKQRKRSSALERI